ncbi:maleylpyruvate isomerase N-terminal domain-containing protein [Aestuariimicrobium ganziense]|uniref:maleylpyruvate isomerase N-terminal domain-containing protein n=1 Tax=Aestuariimicrobium ganziense TaxID=2773677 RepID=UPI0019421F6D|nr:maleylpyruvate isomerase N-terminal domain-containing protein [Aestuariimicrobium ganziense]
MSQISEQHAAVAAEFSRLVDGVTDWDAPTPVKEWRARDIIGHLTSWFPGFLHAMEVDFPDVAAGEDDPAGVWPGFSSQVQDMLDDPERAGAMVTPPGQDDGQQVPLEQVIAQYYISDVAMHSWDLARASGQEANLDPGMVEGMANGMTAMKDTLAASGQFGTPVVLDESRPAIARLVAIIGRDPQWTPPHD